MSVNGRIQKLEKQVKNMTWQEEIYHHVAIGNFTPLDALHGFGTLMIDTWPEWYRDMPEARAIGEEANARISELLKDYTDDDLQAMMDGRMPIPEELGTLLVN